MQEHPNCRCAYWEVDVKIHKKKVPHPSFFERMRKKASKGLGLDWVITFGNYKSCTLRYTIDVDPKYVDKMVRDDVLSLDKEALIYLTIAMQKKRKQEQAEREKYRQQEERDREWRRRQDYFNGGGSEDFDDFFNRFFGGRAHQRQQHYQQQEQRQERITSPEHVHPAHQFDHLPEKARYGKILRLSGEVTKETIRTQYRKLAMQFHPDKSATMDEEFQKFANEWFLQIQKAYEWFKERYDL